VKRKLQVLQEHSVSASEVCKEVKQRPASLAFNTFILTTSSKQLQGARSAADEAVERLQRTPLAWQRNHISFYQPPAELQRNLQVLAQPCGLFVHGQPGMGKTMLAEKLSHHFRPVRIPLLLWRKADSNFALLVCLLMY
jgi:predicted ATPase